MNIFNLIRKVKWILPAPMVLTAVLYSCQGLPSPESKYETVYGRTFFAANGFRLVESLAPNDKIIVVQTGHCNTAVTPDKSFAAETNEVALYIQGSNISVLDPFPSAPAFAVSPDGKYIAGGTYSSVSEDNLKYLLKEKRPISDWEENKLNSGLFIIKELGKERKIIDVLRQPKKYWKVMNSVAWSPDSKKVYYSYGYCEPVTETARSRIESYELSSGQKEVIYETIKSIYKFNISPDCEKLLMREGEGVTVYDIHTRKVKKSIFSRPKYPVPRIIRGGFQITIGHQIATILSLPINCAGYR